MNKAIKDGSWRADYFDVMWKIQKNMWRYKTNPETLKQPAERLADLARSGLPIAIYEYVQKHGGMYDTPAERRRLLNAAMERGNPQAMSLIGGEIASRSVSLFKLGKEMLTCAVKQGEPDAYLSLGKIAFREGRMVDAYRLWEKGANTGCIECIDHMEEFSRLDPGHLPSDSKYGSIPQLKDLREHYSNQFLHLVSGMHTLIVPAPKAYHYYVTNEQIVALIKRHAGQ